MVPNFRVLLNAVRDRNKTMSRKDVDLHSNSSTSIHPTSDHAIENATITVIGLRGIPDISGGIETHCEYLYPKIAQLDANENIVIVGRRPSMGSETISLGKNLKCVPLAAPESRYFETIVNTFYGVLAARFRFQSKTVHLHAVGPGLMAPLARFLGMQVILTHHGDDYKRDKWNRLARTVLKTGERLGIVFANRVIAVSPSLAKRLKTEYPAKAEAIHYVPNGADHILSESGSDQSPMEDWLKKFNLADTSFIVSVGRLVPEKGFVDLIEAYAIARPNAKLVIVGGKSGSSHDDELTALIEDKNLDGSVIMTGAIPREGVAALLKQAELFVLASHHEGLPIAALEASAMGAPTLVSDIQPNLDLGLPAGHYFPVNAPEALAQNLREKLGHIPPVDLLNIFNWDAIARQTSKIYHDLRKREKGDNGFVKSEPT